MPPLFRILGPLEVEGAGPLGGPRPRALLSALLLSPNEVVPAERLIDSVWGERPPATARHALQVYLSQLRKAIPQGRDRIRTEAAGYRIVVAEDELDALRFERLVEQGQALLSVGSDQAAAAVLTDALSLWRGEVEPGDAGDPRIARLEAVRMLAHEDRLEAELRTGRHAQLVPELERRVAEHPLRERLRRQLMLALYRSGRQADALAVYARTRTTLVEELGLEPGPELRALEAAILRQDPALTVTPPPTRRLPRLPAPATPLVGRRREIEAVAALLAGDARVVTVTGPGGAGKTRVAVQVAQEVERQFPDGVVFVGLAALREPELLATEIAGALGIESGARQTLRALIEHLADLGVLLLLDNFEQVDDAAPLLSDLLAGAPRLKLLVSSRRPLRIYGEHEYALPPLRLEEEAVPLFVARARAAGASLEPDEAVERVCEALDCLPLAIELAAARARRLPPAEMLARLPSRLRLASGGPRDAPERHRALHATIAWSHDLLDERLQAIFANLSAFAGGWDDEAALAVAGAGEGDLERLVSHSLVRHHGGRFALLETIREFARIQLQAAGRADEVAARHAVHYAQLAALAERELRHGGDQSAWLDRLEGEMDNLRAALNWLASTDPERELRMAGALSPFWGVRGHAAEGLERLTRALERAGPGRTLDHGHALAGAAAMSWIRGQHAQSRALSEQALGIYRALEHRTGIVRALANLGYVALRAGDHDEARVLYEECLAVARGGDDPRSVTVALNCLTELALASRDLPRARGLGEEGLALARDIGDQESVAIALLNLGFVALHQERLAEAAPSLREAAELFIALGDLEVTAHALAGLACACADRPEVAARLLGAAAAQREQVAGTVEFEPELRARLLEQVRASLGEAAFAAACEAGRALAPAEAVALSRR